LLIVTGVVLIAGAMRQIAVRRPGGPERPRGNCEALVTLVCRRCDGAIAPGDYFTGRKLPQGGGLSAICRVCEPFSSPAVEDAGHVAPGGDIVTYDVRGLTGGP
jgi:hypothetical protein